MRKPTVLLMNRVYPPVRGASGRILRDMARSFVRDGWQVTVITSGARAMNERDGAVKVIRVKGAEKPSGWFGYGVVWIKMFIAALRLPASELVVTMSDPPLFAIAGDVLKRFKKNKHIHWVQDVYPELFPVVGARFPMFLMEFMARRVRSAMMNSDKVVVIGRCMARRLSQVGVAPKMMAVVPNWHDMELGDDQNDPVFDDDAVNVGHYRKPEEQIKESPKFRLLYAGNIGRAHPIDTVLDAARILQNQHPEIEFLFVGDGPKYDAITRAKAQEHLDNVKLLPYQPAARLRRLMESGDVHLISLDSAAAGMSVPSKLYAAIGAHRPCIYIGPSVSETAKVIQDYSFGSVVAQGRAEELADVIRRYRMDGDFWFEAHAGAKKAAGVFVPKASTHAFIERAWHVIGGKPKDAAAPIDDVPSVRDLAAE